MDTYSFIRIIDLLRNLNINETKLQSQLISIINNKKYLWNIQFLKIEKIDIKKKIILEITHKSCFGLYISKVILLPYVNQHGQYCEFKVERANNNNRWNINLYEMLKVVLFSSCLIKNGNCINILKWNKRGTQQIISNVDIPQTGYEKNVFKLHKSLKLNDKSK